MILAEVFFLFISLIWCRSLLHNPWSVQPQQTCLSFKPWTYLVDNLCLHEICFCLGKCTSCYLFLAKAEKMLMTHWKKIIFWNYLSPQWVLNSNGKPFHWTKRKSLTNMFLVTFHQLWLTIYDLCLQQFINLKTFLAAYHHDITSLLHSRCWKSHGLTDLILKPHWPWE